VSKLKTVGLLWYVVNFKHDEFLKRREKHTEVGEFFFKIETNFYCKSKLFHNLKVFQ